MNEVSKPEKGPNEVQISEREEGKVSGAAG